MVFNVARARTYSFLLKEINKSVELFPENCLKAAPQLSPRIHWCCIRNNSVFAYEITSKTCFSGIINNTNMSSSLQPLRCGEGFHSSTNSSDMDGPADGGLPSTDIHGESDGQNPISVRHTPDIEKKYVHHVYDAIAPHFSSTRFAKWPKVASFINSLRPGSVILDAGCGNGKYLGLNPNCFSIGCDISAPLIDICATRGHEVLVADAVNLPYRSNFGDAAISIAVLHHLSTESRRRKATEELVRVVMKGGLVLITVWAVEQEDRSLLTKWTPLTLKYEEEWVKPSSPCIRNPSTITLESIPETNEDGNHDVNLSEKVYNPFKYHGEQSNEVEEATAPVPSEVGGSSVASGNCNKEGHQEYFVPWHLPYHRAEISGASASALTSGLAKKDDKKGAVVYNRYYHVFMEGELERLVSGLDDAVVVDRFYDKSNWCIILEKR